jgi:recombinational DNA repair ATPase RecF
MDASVVLSRGQQKRFNIAFALAQRDIISCAKEISVITMIDDLTSEIDSTNLVRILSRMADSKDQFLITAIDLLLIPEQFRSKEMAKMFHVEHGRIT